MSSRRVRRRRNKRRSLTSISPEPAISGTYNEITVPGNYPWGGIDYKEVINTRPVSYDELQLMVDMDGHARSLFNALRRPILRNAQNVFIKPVKSGVGEEEAEFIHNNLLGIRPLGGMEIPFTKIVAHQCMAMLFGFKAFEIKHDRPGTIVDDNKIRLAKLGPRDSRTVTFLTDDKGGFDGIRVRTSWKGRLVDKSLTKDRSVYFAVDEEENPFYGKSLFLPSYYHFDKKHKIYYITHLALAVGAMAPRIAKAQSSISEADKKTFLDALSNLGTNAAMLIPDGFEILDQKSIGGQPGRYPFMDMIRHHDLMMSQSLLAQVVDIGTGAGAGGGFSLSKNHLDMLNMLIEQIMFDMGNMWNFELIPELIDWNFGTQNYPKLVFPPLTTEIKEATAEIFNKMITARENRLSPEFAAEIEEEMSTFLGLDVDTEAIKANQERLIAQEELEIAMEQANARVSRSDNRNDFMNMSVPELLQDPEFLNWAEELTDNISKKQMDNSVRLAMAEQG